jgi:hypothetical protein
LRLRGDNFGINSEALHYCIIAARASTGTFFCREFTAFPVLAVHGTSNVEGIGIRRSRDLSRRRSRDLSRGRSRDLSRRRSRDLSRGRSRDLSRGRSRGLGSRLAISLSQRGRQK